MASKLCCTAEQEGRPDSPELPNARISEATPAKRPLLPKRPESAGSRFTSARSEDLHELRQIFNSAKESETPTLSPSPVRRSPFLKPSLYSLHSLHKMTSIHEFIRRKFSQDVLKTNSDTQLKESTPKKKPTNEEPNTVVKVPREGPNLQLKITKSDLRNHLLSDKKPDEGGYDPDAEMLDDIAKDIGKKTPSKRPSLHSIDWTSSPGSKPTTASSKGGHSPVVGRDSQPYKIKQSQSSSRIPMSTRFGQVTSSPNLRLTTPKSKDRQLRRSHSATSKHAAAPPPLSSPMCMRLPSMNMLEPDSVTWSVSMAESLRLSQFPIPFCKLGAGSSMASLVVNNSSTDSADKLPSDKSGPSREPSKIPISVKGCKVSQPQISDQQPTSPRSSGSVHDSLKQDILPEKRDASKEVDNENEDENPRRSVHLYSMRISHHLRSGSLLSWDNLADAPDMSTPKHPFGDRTPSHQSRVSQLHSLSTRTRHDRRTSSSGFASSKVPSKWGKVLSKDREHREDMSSIYSSRPQSPPDSFGGSMVNLSSVTHFDALNRTPSVIAQKRHSDSYPPTDNEETPRPGHRYGVTYLQAASTTTATNSLLDHPTSLARNNSVANTKKSKFREEFSPEPPRKKQSASIMNFLHPKRNSIRSQSETNLRAGSIAVDGPFDHPHSAPGRERHLSRSMMSLKTEQQAAGKEKTSNPMWERALKSHQEERSSFFLPQNKALATQGSPFRERSGSVVKPRASLNEEIPPHFPLNTSKRLSVPFLEPPKFNSSFSNPKRLSAPGSESTAPDDDVELDFIPALFKRRSAVVHRDKNNMSPNQEMQAAFDRQTDDAATTGAWGRYPSYSRPERTNSAGHADNVRARDFALENAIQFAMGRNVDHEIDPTARPESPVLVNGKKRKKRVGSGRMAKSNSMTFGKQFLKNYTKIFRSQSTEFQRHGRGHRSSIATGGTLEYPELEMLPEVWSRDIIEERNRNNSVESHRPESLKTKDKKVKGKMKAENSTATLRPTYDKSGDSTYTFDGAGKDTAGDRARVWSVYYEDCVPSFPRPSLEWRHHADLQDVELQELGRITARHSLDSTRGASQSRTLPARLGNHSRHESRLSRASIVSHSSVRPGFVYTGEVGDGDVDIAEERSMVSVRRSTIDLITMYRKQEIVERERVLSLARAESVNFRVESRRSERDRGVMAV
ncbi:hypothetical protein K504DRAFT_476620 [Pleomassaria siparia CBS 279.74]|uniref:Uncharacterized protein n=1 Tax=Pleomassaria siparia CBS 279.74 TaxID=1314801 RepID=A0A6G1K8P2_9PLEO|nr:hypothetical protein K504DRAFT_476620 [Pleomassaria siparia CBS 279.74]